MTRTIRTAACTSIGIAMLVVATPATPRFSILDLGTLPGDHYSVALDINNRGQIVGVSVREFAPHPFVWEDGVMTALPLAPGPSDGVAAAINDRGQIVGISGFEAVLWEDGTVTSLASSSAPRGACGATDINNQGQVVGSCTEGPFLWEDGVLTWLPALPGGELWGPVGINGVGLVLGAAQPVGGELRRFLWWQGAALTLPSTLSIPNGMNSWAQVVGLARDASGTHAVLWQWGRIITLRTIPGVRFTTAEAINDRGQIVGMAGAKPVLWEHRSLIQLPLVRDDNLGGAMGINNRGDIVGFMGPPDTQGNATLWLHVGPS
jgi:probable HAF family extracellular repeat protein